MDRVFIRDLLLRAIVGINDDERVKKQDVVINIELDVDCRPAAASDAIEDALNYRDIAKETIDLVENSSFFLVERLAEAIARLCLADVRVRRVRVTVEKPTAVRFAKSVGVSIEREREERGREERGREERGREERGREERGREERGRDDA